MQVRAAISNILSIDVEEVYHGEYMRRYYVTGKEWRTPVNIPPLLEFLDDLKTKATFFLTGELAQKFPGIPELILRHGHEVAFHGWSHVSLRDESELTLRQESRDFKSMFPNCIGFRAPSFSLCRKTAWALRVLNEEGFVYDSSVFPALTPLYGLWRAPMHPYKPSLVNPADESGLKEGITEFPLAAYSLLGFRIPAGGGFWLRLFGPNLVVAAAARLNERGHPAVVYVHNWELDPLTERLDESFMRSFVTYHHLSHTRASLSHVLSSNRFTSFQNYLRKSL